MKRTLFTTGFEALDEMLGGGLPAGSVVLLRGGPGSGKTTIALHVMAHLLGTADIARAIFFSLELEPDRALAHAGRFVPCRQLQQFESSDRLRPVEVADLRTTWAKFKRKSRSPGGLEKLVLQYLEQMPWVGKKREEPRLVVVDSLNVLTDLLTTLGLDGGGGTRGGARPANNLSLRTAMRCISQAVRSWGPNTITLFLGEYHPGDSKRQEIESESFLCDVELLLTPETVAGDIRSNLECINPLGYVMERQMPETGKQAEGKPQAIEVRSFCRVLKSRYTRSQSRRCTYDVIDREGVKFFPTYPGDGAMLLFGENDPQNRFWDEFVFNEVPYSYPALRYERFGRKALQRVFATQRHWRHIPDRTDLYVGSFDSYWIRCYTEQYERGLLNDLLRRELGPLVRHLTDPAIADLLRKLGELARTADKKPPADAKTLPFCTEVLAARLQSFFDGQPAPAEAAPPNWDSLWTKLGEDAWSIVTPDPAAVSLPTVAPDAAKLELPAATIYQRFVKNIFAGLERDQQPDGAAAVSIIQALLQEPKIFPKKKVYTDRVEHLVSDAREERGSPAGKGGIFHPIDKDQLRLYGNRGHRVIRHIERAGELKDQGKYRTVPYNANVSFLVYRVDLLRGKPPASEEALREFYREETDALAAFERDAEISATTLPTFDDAFARLKELEQKARAKLKPNAVLPPHTWEQLVVLAEGAGCFLIETQTFDTFLCAMLEMFWAYGGVMEVSEAYQIANPDEFKRRLFQTFYLLRHMFRKNIVPPHSTLDSEIFGEVAKPPAYEQAAAESDDVAPQAERSGSVRGQWCFARHWYSTFVDLLTARPANPGARHEDNRPKTWAWDPGDGVELDIMPIPTTLQRFENDTYPRRHSCWGDWHLGVLRGSENTELGMSILNNLLSSNKICEAAFRGAILPTVEEFYETYQNTRCFNLPERARKMKLPGTTFGELRRDYMENAISRSKDLFDYRHCMRELHSALNAIYNKPEMEDPELSKIVKSVVTDIGKLKYQASLLY